MLKNEVDILGFESFEDYDTMLIVQTKAIAFRLSEIYIAFLSGGSLSQIAFHILKFSSNE
jgi:hypothetical protein